MKLEYDAAPFQPAEGFGEIGKMSADDDDDEKEEEEGRGEGARTGGQKAERRAAAWESGPLILRGPLDLALGVEARL